MRIRLFNRNPDVATDPVCDMQVDMGKPNGGTYDYRGETYYFCGPGL